MKALFLDDDELANELVTYILEFAGITNYTICTSGNDALKYLKACKQNNDFPDIIFVDINMPGMNGFEFVGFYEKHFLTYSRKTKVIMLTNSVLSNEKIMAGKYESISDLWNKPLNTEKLINLLDTVKPDR